ncbi:hypothetical protein [Streptomyces sp. SID3343]|uniref:hypothetical protein n=1 Tax=Streptomyces sp. SID3343 TaxID=2690260 RepID=UPI00136BFE55|nr:hypothetical protein [Streptomyces sp. SID3343]MYV99852.1 hypothetical protein [Streptomyces sp. SID3343]
MFWSRTNGGRAGLTATGAVYRDAAWEPAQGPVERDRPAVTAKVTVHAHDCVGGDGVDEGFGDVAESAVDTGCAPVCAGARRG